MAKLRVKCEQTQISKNALLIVFCPKCVFISVLNTVFAER